MVLDKENADKPQQKSEKYWEMKYNREKKFYHKLGIHDKKNIINKIKHDELHRSLYIDFGVCFMNENNNKDFVSTKFITDSKISVSHYLMNNGAEIPYIGSKIDNCEPCFSKLNVIDHYSGISKIHYREYLKRYKRGARISNNLYIKYEETVFNIYSSDFKSF